MRNRGMMIGSAVAAALLTVPSVLSAVDRSAGLSAAPSPLGGGPRSLDGLRYQAAVSLAEGRYASAAAEARAVLARQPLDRSSLRILSRAADAQGEGDLANDVALAASFVSWRDPYVQQRLFLQMAMLGKVDDAARRADALSRTRAGRSKGFQSLNRLLAMRGGTDAVAARLAAGPPWREDYFADGREGLGAAAQHAVPLVRALARTSGPASSAEIDRILSLMVARGIGAEAWAYARERSGAAAGALIDDPDFQTQVDESGQANSPFAWSMPADTPIRLVGHRDEAGRPALRIEVRGDRGVLFVSRRVIVAPGRYRLSYQFEGGAEARDRMHPDLRCSSGAAVKTQPTGDPGSTVWTADIPADCPLLQLGFSVEAGDTAAPVEVAIRRVAFARP